MRIDITSTTTAFEGTTFGPVGTYQKLRGKAFGELDPDDPHMAVNTIRRSNRNRAMPQTLEFWIGYGSTYSYLSVMRIDALAERRGVPVVWKPFNIRVLMVEKGLPTGPFVPRPDKLAYMWRDLERRAQRRGLPYVKPSQYPVDSQATVRVAFLAAGEGWCSEFSKRVFQMNFVESQPIGGAGNLESALRDLGHDPATTIRRAHEPDVEAALAAQTRTAIDIGVFGAPTFRVGEELFWGDDRLEDALEWAETGRLSPSDRE